MKATGTFTVGKGALLPHDARAREMWPRLKIGDRVLVKVHHARNPQHNELAHAVIDRIASAMGLPVDVIKLWLKWETGRVDLVALPNGKYIHSPRSLSFAAMSQDEFQEFWNEAWLVISEKIMPRIPLQDLEEIQAIVAGSTPRSELSASGGS